MSIEERKGLSLEEAFPDEVDEEETVGEDAQTEEETPLDDAPEEKDPELQDPETDLEPGGGCPRPANIFHVERLFLMLCYVAYCRNFPRRMISRTAGFSDWTRRKTYEAVEKGYLLEGHYEWRKHNADTLRISVKGMDYIARKNPEVFAEVAAERDSRSYKTTPTAQGVARAHALASVLIMAQNAGAIVRARDKPSLMYDEMMREKKTIYPQVPYFYTSGEVRAAMQAKAPDLQFKGSQLCGVIVQGQTCYFLYFAGYNRLYWMRPSEENYVGGITSMLNTRGFSIRTIAQVLIGNRMTTSKKHYKRNNRRAKPYFVLSEFYNHCYFVTNNDDGDALLRIMIHEDLQRKVTEKALVNCRLTERMMRGYDAIEEGSGRPVLLNFMFDMLPLETTYMAGEVLGKNPIVLCFDEQVEVMQSLVEPQIEMRGIGKAADYA